MSHTERSVNHVRIQCFVRGPLSIQRSNAFTLVPARFTQGVFSTATGTPVMRSDSTTSSSDASTIARLYASLALHSGVAMKRSGLFLQNDYGPFGYAFGHGRQNDSCLYAWQWIDGQTRQYLPVGNKNAAGPISVRVRLCRPGMTEEVMVDLVRQMYVSPRYDDGYRGPTTGAPMAGGGQSSGLMTNAVRTGRTGSGLMFSGGLVVVGAATEVSLFFERPPGINSTPRMGTNIAVAPRTPTMAVIIRLLRRAVSLMIRANYPSESETRVTCRRHWAKATTSTPYSTAPRS